MLSENLCTMNFFSYCVGLNVECVIEFGWHLWKIEVVSLKKSATFKVMISKIFYFHSWFLANSYSASTAKFKELSSKKTWLERVCYNILPLH